MKPTLYGWEIGRLLRDPRDEKVKRRQVMWIAAETLEQVWDYLAVDRADAATEIESIARVAPLLEVIRTPAAAAAGEAFKKELEK